MLEILLISLLSGKNGRIASERGRKPGGFQGATFALWFGGELLGFFIGMAATDGEVLPSYGVALLLAAIGGIVSYIIAKNCKPGTFRQDGGLPAGGLQPLAAPCALSVTREKSFVGAVVPYHVYLNDNHIGTLKNGQSLQASTAWAQNTLVVKDAYGSQLKPLHFSVAPGGNAHIVFSRSKILPEKSTGLLPQGAPQALVQPGPPSGSWQPMAAAQPQPAALAPPAMPVAQPALQPAQPVQSQPAHHFCTSCGTLLPAGMQFCRGCGALAAAT